ncbi:MAG: response regulator [Acidobacteria bacterium]|nr:response regulator [Acidobacteriota bacterium]
MIWTSAAHGSVLAVDDDPDALEALATALGELGYDVWQSLDGLTALTLAAERQPDVILLDVHMPGINGYEVCRRLKSDERTQLIPVVFLTGESSRAGRLKGLEAGATDFLQKPCDLVELDVRVRNLVHFRKLTEDLDSAEHVVFSIAKVIEARDEGTGEHCDRLSRMASQLGRTLALAKEDIVALERGGYLHDIGKVGIPDAVLLKPGPLTAEEWEIMRRHVIIGVEICQPLRTLRSVLPIIRHHHEHWDGSGYPDGLKGEEIPLIARVFQVTDVFDALTSDRCYRKGLPIPEALALLHEETVKKGWWDPAIVHVFGELVASGELIAGREPSHS